MVTGMFNTILILLMVCVAVHGVFHFFRLPAILGYIIVGMLFGPQGFAVIPDTLNVQYLAEFGIVFLLFMVGLEFSVAKLRQMRKAVIGYGGLQVLFCIMVTAFIALFFKMSFAGALIVGCVVAMSSTAIVLHQLTERHELTAPYARNAVGILLFQDLAVVPCLILIPELANGMQSSLLLELSWAFLKGILAVVFILGLGRWIIRPIFHEIASKYNRELSTLLILLLTLGAAWLTEHLHLSMGLGAFMAGMLLSESDFKRQIEADIRPLRDVLLGLFFITIGMAFKINVLAYAWQWVLLLFIALIFFKFVVIFLLGLKYNGQKIDALRTGIILAQGGEFGIVLVNLAVSYHLFSADYGQVMLGAILMSMALAPLLFRHNYALARWISRKA